MMSNSFCIQYHQHFTSSFFAQKCLCLVIFLAFYATIFFFAKAVFKILVKLTSISLSLSHTHPISLLLPYHLYIFKYNRGNRMGWNATGPSLKIVLSKVTKCIYSTLVWWKYYLPCESIKSTFVLLKSHAIEKKFWLIIL